MSETDRLSELLSQREAEIAQLEADLAVARDATRAAGRRAGEADAERRVLEDELAAARAAQSEWDELVGHIERERVVAAEAAAELEAVKASTTWRIGSMIVRPLSLLRGRREP